MIKVLEIGMSRNIGGTETYLMEQYRHLNRKLIRFDFVNFTGEYPMAFEDEIKNNGDIVYNIVSRKKNPIKHYYKWFTFLKKVHEQYDVIVLNSCDLYHMCPLFFAKLLGIKVRIFHSHNNGSEKKETFLRKILIKLNKLLMYYSVTNYWACSKSAGEYMFGNAISFKVINNGIDTRKYIYNENTRKKLRIKLEIENKFVVGHVGRFSYQKNHLFLIDVFYEVQKKEPNSILLLVGKKEGVFFEKVREKVNKLKIKDKVLFLGVQKNVFEFYQAMDCFVLPSLFEGFGIVSIESQAAGLKTIVSKNVIEDVAITDLIEYISLNDSLDFWADRILSAKQCQRKNMYNEIVKSGYDIKTISKNVQDLFIEMVNR